MPATKQAVEDGPKHRWLGSALRDSRGALRDVLLVSLFVNLLALAAPIFVLQVYDRVVFHAGLTTLQGLVVGMAVVIAFDYALRQARSRIFQAVAANLDISVGQALFDKILSLPLRALEGRPAVYWQSLFRDLDLVRNALAGPSAALAIDLPFAVLFLVLILLVAPAVAWVIIGLSPLFMLLAWRSGKTMRRTAASEREQVLSREGLLNELIASRATVKSLALADAMRPRWEDRHAATIELSQERGRAADGHQVLAHVMMVMTTVAITSVGALAILDQRMTIGALIAANMLGARTIAPMSQLVGQWRMLTRLRQSMARLDSVFALASDRAAAAVALQRPKGAVRLESVKFSYDSGAPMVIDGIDGRIGPRGMHGIVGRNGCGKSTLLKIVAGLYAPREGRVLLDEADILQFSRSELAGWVAYLPQQCTLFSGTIRDNICIAHPGASDAAIIDAAEKALVHQYIIDLPDGYAADVGEWGARLSDGQRQRIALARVFLGDPPVMLFDEPTSDLDNDAERQLAQTLRRTAQDSTVLVATHSPAVLSLCDTILLLDGGRVAMAGPARDVLRKLQPRPTNAAMLHEGRSA